MSDGLLAERYGRALAEFIFSSSEADLEVAYEIGRDALQEGLSLGEVSELHYSATQDLIDEDRVSIATVEHSQVFFLQIAAVYDMALRGYRDTIGQLQVEIAERVKAEQQLREMALELSRERDLLQQRVAERTESLRLQADELARKNEELKRRNRELNDFAHIASHDLKEPLRSISMHASILLEGCEASLDPEVRHRLDRLMKLAGRMSRLIADLLHYSNLGRDDHEVETVDLAKLVADVEATLADTLIARNARIVVAGPLPMVRGSRALLTSIFQNLISNGTKYNAAPEKIIEIGSASIADEDTTAFEVLYVRDNGVGIEEEFHQEIFRIFKRLDSGKAYGEGTGAGLTFVKKIVEDYGGKIWLTSRSGEGTTFYLTLMKYPKS